MLARLHLVRHGEVLNPGHLVYADLPGFLLSEAGRREADAAARRLAHRPLDVVVSSPLERAVETAGPIAAAHGLAVHVDPRLTEWRLLSRWAGHPWEELPSRYPGEVESYLAHPEHLPFSPESLEELAARLASVVDDLGRAHPGGAAALVSHQDPVQALRLHLTGRPAGDLASGKPAHGTVLTLEAGRPWREAERWDPPDG